jgi:hypothetical protein
MNLQLREICRCTRKNMGKGAEAYQASPYIPPSFSAMKGSCQLHHFLAHSTEQQILQICLRRGGHQYTRIQESSLLYSCPLNSTTMLVSSCTFFWRDLMYSTASSSISEVFVCLSILGTTPCNFFIRSLIRVRRTRSAILRGCVAHPRLARVPLTVSRKEVSSTTGLICVLPTGRLICLVRLPATPGLLLIEPSAI